MSTQLISIVDDNDSVRAAMMRLIRSVGAAAVTFTSAEDFLKSPCLKDVACLISDVQMPGMNGLELQEALLVEGHCLPIIFITANTDPGLRERARARGAAAIFTEDLVSLLLKLLHK
jgi:FixJ family two-component response regulator